MVRSLYCGISGLRNHQVAMDVTSNNIANVNTVGFKSGRVTFEESMAQLLKGAMRPPGNAGGTNPMQVGLGMSVGSIDTILTQGNLESTGKITDIALEGRAYFVYSSGEGDFYSRAGGIQMDSEGYMVSPTNGYRLQGMIANAEGEYPPGTSIGDIRIPYGQKAPAKATTEVRYSSNLDSDSQALGTEVHTNRYISDATGDDILVDIFDENGEDLGIKNGDTITITATDSGGTSYTSNFNISTTTDLDELATEIQNLLRANIDGSINVGMGATTAGYMEVDLSGAGAGTEVNNLTVTSDRPGSDSFVAALFSWDNNMTQATGAYDNVYGVRAPAESTDLLSAIYDASGNTLGLEAGLTPDTITINGAVGGNTITTRTVTYTAAMDLETLMNEMQSAFNLPDQVIGSDGNYHTSVALNAPNTDSDGFPTGSIVIRGQAGESFSLSNVSVTANNADNDSTAPTRFNANMIATETQTARDPGIHSTSIVVYDESGDSHTITTTFIPTQNAGEWLWEITTESGEQIQGGNTGNITFGQDGSPSSFTFDDNSTAFKFDPMNGSNIVSVHLDIGSPGSFDGITQFRSESTTAAREQDGYPMGKLEEISIDEYGDISGVYTNGVSMGIARIYVAEFNNPAGLLKRGDSMYAISNNSGEGVKLRPGIGSATKLKPGALEMSNVDLATEFTKMITTQRGYQANARVITTSDTLLQELVQLVR